MDLCENIHLHLRDLRLDFSAVEYAQLRALIDNSGMAIERQIEKDSWREGDSNYCVQFHPKFKVSGNSDFYPDRLTIEEQRDSTIHVHFRDLRLHLTPADFLTLCDAFAEAKEKFDTIDPPFPGKDVKEPTRMVVPIESVNPWDPAHKPMSAEYEANHRNGIETIKKAILAGKKIRPIVVLPDGQRRDGFKRYMAFKELGYKEIEVIVDPNAHYGCQQGQDLEDNDA